MMVPLLEASDWVQCSVHSPSPFICTHRQHLLPAWQAAPKSVIVILQRCSVSLSLCTAQTEHQKNVLRGRFLYMGSAIRRQLHALGYDIEIFDPKSGYPTLSSPGALHLDDVAVARQMLHYAASVQGICTYLIHPQWHDAVYPATLVSDAPVDRVQALLSTVHLPQWYPESQQLSNNIRLANRLGLAHFQTAIALTLNGFRLNNMGEIFQELAIVSNLNPSSKMTLALAAM